MQTSNKTIVVTGACSGIGKFLVKALRDDGWPVIATDIIDSSNCIFLDLANSDSIDKAVKEIYEITQGMIYALINNAGIGYLGPLADITRDDLRKQFEVNLFGVHELIIKMMPLLMQNGNSRIINIGSINGRISFPNMGAYSSSKFALTALTDALRVELKNTMVKVSIIEPGTIESNFRNNAVCKNIVLTEKKGRDPNIVYKKVKIVLKSKNPAPRYLAGDEYLIYAKKFLPERLFNWLIKNLYNY